MKMEDRLREQCEAAGDVKTAEEEEKTSPVALLPDDVLAEALRRLPPQGLAVSRCVCRAWRDVVDARRLLRADLLPLSLGGIFITFCNHCLSEFISPCSAGRPSISGKHDYLPTADGSPSWGNVLDHCNGLLLVDGYEMSHVLNPATRWVAPLPPCPPPPVDMNDCQEQYLAYDPTASLDYEVVSIFRFHCRHSKRILRSEVEQAEWPPSICILPVFSSRTGQWEERPFARQGEPIGIVADMRHGAGDRRNAVYWRGALYVHCQTDFVMRISLSSDKYHTIKPPMGIEAESLPLFYLGKSTNGVCCASTKGKCGVQVWNLDESGYKMEWVLKHDIDLSRWLLKHKLEYTRPNKSYYGPIIQGPWTFQDINYYHYSNKYPEDDDRMEAPVEDELEYRSEASVEDDEKFEWSSNDQDGYYRGYLHILGFHPCKEIIFLSESITRGLAYHLNSSKVEVLGNIYPAEYYKESGDEQFIESSFPYTPCWLEQNPGENS